MKLIGVIMGILFLVVTSSSSFAQSSAPNKNRGDAWKDRENKKVDDQRDRDLQNERERKNDAAENVGGTRGKSPREGEIEAAAKDKKQQIDKARDMMGKQADKADKPAKDKQKSSQ
ncbi:MAG: hypothetical protein V2B18_25215 [Pseudomonadota bacterium]